jgi:hypothetical protein
MTDFPLRTPKHASFIDRLIFGQPRKDEADDGSHGAIEKREEATARSRYSQKYGYSDTRAQANCKLQPGEIDLIGTTVGRQRWRVVCQVLDIRTMKERILTAITPVSFNKS